LGKNQEIFVTNLSPKPEEFNFQQGVVVWKKCHSESAARFDRLSDRAADEESISLLRRFFPPEPGGRQTQSDTPSLKFIKIKQNSNIFMK